ncbi:hypothetical protein BH20ACT24_BH20ACT24_03470 [soil metagenome]|nr:NUDIX hydrolase [Actinomycetota bacterium]
MPQRRGGTRFEHSAGGVVLRSARSGAEVVLASRRSARGSLAWGLPKGLVEAEESPEDTAVREVLEETGLRAEVRRPLGDISYWYVWNGDRVHKTVSFFLMEAAGGDFSQRDSEMEEVRWFPPDEAVRTASYRGEQDVLRRAMEALAAEGAE